jgi:serine/threonine protein kinase/tetratricopeptide (TPR) repeat protein
MIGKTLNHYKITGSLGKGGMGEVYLAVDTRLDRKVALKILPEAMAADADRLARFTREAKAIAALNHPNIITIHAVEEADGVRFLAMEHIEGRTLDHIILKDGMPVSRILDIAVPLADALSAAHDKGITHRDLKPANVMFTDTGRVKMLDFGLAKHVEQVPESPDTQLPTEHVTKEGVVMGTLPYMSPEQAEGKPTDHRSDIFSLGIMLYEMAAGARPFSGDTTPGLLSSIIKDEAPSLTAIREELPADLARVVGRCLMKNPLERFQTSRDVFNELRTLQRQIDSGQSVLTGSSPGLGGATSEKSSSLPMTSGILAIVALLALGAWWFLGRTQENSDGSAAPVASTEKKTPASETGRTMMVVLPFENLGQPEDDFFAAGMAEEITSRLASISSLGVISRKSAMSYAGTDKTIRQIGEELSVEYVLEGTIRWARAAPGSSRVRITPQLIRVSDDTQVWSDSYDRVIDDIFAVQAEIATQVTDQLGINLLDADRAILEQKPTEDVQAYEEFLRGKDYLAHYDLDNLEKSVAYFNRALKKDPDFMEAHALLARAHSIIIHFGYDTSPTRDRLAQSEAEKALELAPNSSIAHVAMGYYHYHGHKDYQAALDSFQRAAEISPDDADLLIGMALVLRRQGRWEESSRQFENALILSPRDDRALLDLGDNLMTMGRYSEALKWLEKAESVRPDRPWVYFYQALTHRLWKGDLAASRDVLESMPPGDQPTTEQMWASQLFLEEDFEGAIRYLEGALPQWPALGSTGRTPTLMSAFAHQLKGDQEVALRLYETVRQELEPLVASGSIRGERMRSALGIAYAGLGRKEDALREGHLSVENYPISRDAVWGGQNLSDLATIQVMVADMDGAFETLTTLFSIPQGQVSLALLKIDPAWAPLHDHPDYKNFLGNLPK